MIEQPSVLLKVADSILGWFSFLRKERSERAEMERRALKVLCVALNETVLYFRRLERSYLAKTEQERPRFERNIEIEEALSRLWMEAAVDLRGANEDLAERCFLKGGYWADRDG